MSASEFPAIRHLLTRIGLNDRECDVYLTLLPMKVARVAQVAKGAKQSRSNTYLLLRSLEEKGLVAEVERGKVIHFIAEPADRLVGYVKDREQEYHELEPLVSGALPFLSSLTQPLPGEPRVTVLHGTEGIRRVYRDVLMRSFVAFFNAQTDYDHFGSNMIHTLFGKRAFLRGKDLIVNNSSAKRYIKECPPHEEYEIRLLPKGITFDVNMIVFDDEVAIFTFADKPTTIRIENQSFANALRSLHEAFWTLSSRVE